MKYSKEKNKPIVKLFDESKAKIARDTLASQIALKKKMKPGGCSNG